jgi:CubicO group peptidase (beta-lactamase class C family)
MKKWCLIALLLIPIQWINAQSKVQRIKKLDGSSISGIELDSGIQHIVDAAKIMGLCVVILQKDKVAYQQFFGYKNSETKQKPTPETVWYAASFTKPVVAYLCLKLVDQGQFDLDRPVLSYLKKPIAEYEKFKDLAQEPNFAKVTPRMLLSHSSGLPILRGFYQEKLNLITEPGTRFYYSNEGMNLLGLTVEEATGKNLQILAKELVFDPLGMKRTGLIWQPAFESDYAIGHNAQGEPLGAQKRTSVRAAGSMVTTALDYAQFVNALLQKQGLSKAAYQQYFQPQIAVGSKAGFGPNRDVFDNAFQSMQLAWGLGWGLFQSPAGFAFFHSGNTEGWQNYVVAYPKKKTAIILMSNTDNFEAVADQLLALDIGDRYSPVKWLGYKQ